MSLSDARMYQEWAEIAAAGIDGKRLTYGGLISGA